MRLFHLCLFALLAGAISPFSSYSQTQSTDAESIFGILGHFDPLVVSIETDLKQLQSDKNDESWQPAVFKVLKGDSVAFQRAVQIAARGNMRKKTCDFPPVKIKFYQQTPANDSLADINELKLVTSCNGAYQNEEWVQKERLIYELYNLVADQSFRTKSAATTFVDTGKKQRTMKSVSFFIESEEELAYRIGGKPMKPRVGSTHSLDSASYDKLCLFEFMIGNTDWSARARHNIKLIYLNATKSIIAVPYDFDYAGAVGTDYAVPNGDYPIQTVQDRFYLGLCRPAAHYQKMFDFYLEQKSAMIEHCENAGYLPPDTRKQMIRYFEEFFKTLQDPRLAKRDILQNCNKGR